MLAGKGCACWHPVSLEGAFCNVCKRVVQNLGLAIESIAPLHIHNHFIFGYPSCSLTFLIFMKHGIC